jgi:transcriptional regulator of acetoin/glycerol metabolism
MVVLEGGTDMTDLTKSAVVKNIENRYAVPAIGRRPASSPNLKEILKALYAEYGDMQQVADELGVYRTTLHVWMRSLGLRAKRYHNVLEDVAQERVSAK